MIKLPPSELAFMNSLADEAGIESLTTGTCLSYSPWEGRAVKGLEKKGFLMNMSGEVKLHQPALDFVDELLRQRVSANQNDAS